MEIRQSSIIQDSRRTITPILLFITLTLCLASFAARNVSAQDWSLDEIIPGRWENRDINDVYFIGNQGWAVGDSGIIIHTQDGVRWHPQLSGFENDDLHGVYFHDANVGWIAGEDGVVLRTEDGGITWRQRTNSGFDLYDIWFADDRYGWAVGESGRIIYTTNGGVTWKMDRVGTRTLYAAYFLNGINGWVTGAGGNIYHWNGSNWSGHQSNTSKNLYGMYFTSATDGWIVGEQGKVSYFTPATPHTGSRGKITHLLTAMTSIPYTSQKANGIMAG